MDQKKIGLFLKGLRTEKKLTQEKLAERLGVSRRSVSRWETGSNMPDLDILMELADYYEVDLRELLKGERKEEAMNEELKETVLRVADYSNEEKQKITRIMCRLCITGLLSFAVFFALLFARPEEPRFWYGFAEGMSLGIPFAVLLAGAVMTSRYAAGIRAFKRRALERRGA